MKWHNSDPKHIIYCTLQIVLTQKKNDCQMIKTSISLMSPQCRMTGEYCHTTNPIQASIWYYCTLNIKTGIRFWLDFSISPVTVDPLFLFNCCSEVSLSLSAFSVVWLVEPPSVLFSRYKTYTITSVCNFLQPKSMKYHSKTVVPSAIRLYWIKQYCSQPTKPKPLSSVFRFSCKTSNELTSLGSTGSSQLSSLSFRPSIRDSTIANLSLLLLETMLRLLICFCSTFYSVTEDGVLKY